MLRSSLHNPALTPPPALHVCFLFVQLVELNGCSVCRLAVDEPIGCRLYTVVSSGHPVIVHNGRRKDEVCFEVSVFAPWVFHDEAKATACCHGEHLDGEAVKIGAVFVPLQYRVCFFLDGHSLVVDASPCEVHLARGAEIDARKEGDDDVLGADVVPKARFAVVGILDGLEEVVGVVSLSEVVLYVVVFGRDA